MSYTYANRKRGERAAAQKETAPAQPSLDALRAGAAQPTAEQMGHRVDLPEAMRAKMEESFGADLSAVKLYESEAVGAAGAEAVTQGSSIAFAPGMLDFSSYGGQALLGHEISHVVSQSRGEVTGGGFLNDHALEARADREGAMAAAGQQVAMPAAAMSSVSAAPAAGPMQAKKSVEKTDRLAQKNYSKAVKNMDKAKAHHEKGNTRRSNWYQKRANKNNLWGEYWSKKGNSDEDNAMMSFWSGRENRSDMPFFFKDYYQDAPGYLNPANEEDFAEAREAAEEMSMRRHRSNGFY